MSDQDLLRRFLFEDLGVRGHWVKLTTSWQTAKQHQQCANDMELQLGQALSAVVLLSATIKFTGTMIMQAQGNGPLQTLVAQATNDRKIRGLIRTGNVEQIPETLQDLFGEGQLALTIRSENSQNYQGIVPLQGNNLAEALENYFAQSEQLNTRLWLYADNNTASGLLLQELPAKLHNQDDWERITLLADTVTSREMLNLDCETLLFRLFNQEKVRLFDSEQIAFECGCSSAKIQHALRMLGKAELENSLQEQNVIDVNCEFCNRHYHFDRIDVEHLLRGGDVFVADSPTHH
ncbi:MAG: Hsp33 family molecular chaperone HslO [Gammaproteobacteria bacterium]|nr:Hsp33 family molecular chaperone HslO [Gammaproteobacteria bacterium]